MCEREMLPIKAKINEGVGGETKGSRVEDGDRKKKKWKKEYKSDTKEEGTVQNLEEKLEGRKKR